MNELGGKWHLPDESGSENTRSQRYGDELLAGLSAGVPTSMETALAFVMAVPLLGVPAAIIALAHGDLPIIRAGAAVASSLTCAAMAVSWAHMFREMHWAGRALGLSTEVLGFQLLTGLCVMGLAAVAVVEPLLGPFVVLTNLCLLAGNRHLHRRGHARRLVHNHRKAHPGPRIRGWLQQANAQTAEWLATTSVSDEFSNGPQPRGRVTVPIMLLMLVAGRAVLAQALDSELVGNEARAPVIQRGSLALLLTLAVLPIALLARKVMCRYLVRRAVHSPWGHIVAFWPAVITLGVLQIALLSLDYWDIQVSPSDRLVELDVAVLYVNAAIAGAAIKLGGDSVLRRPNQGERNRAVLRQWNWIDRTLETWTPSESTQASAYHKPYLLRRIMTKMYEQLTGQTPKKRRERN